MILEGKTYKAVKQGNTGINYIPDNSDPSFIFGQGVIGAYDWDGYIPYAQGWAVPDDNNPSSSIEFQPYTVISGTYVFSFFVRMNSGGVPIVEYPIAGRDLNVNVFGNTTVYKEHIGDNIYRVWSYNTIATSAGSSVGVGKNTINTNNGFVAWGFQLEPGTIPSVPTPTTGTEITTVPEIKLKPILGNGIVYKPVSLLTETDAVLSRAISEGNTLPSDQTIFNLNEFIRESINIGCWQKQDSILQMAGYNSSVLNGFGKINLKNPWSITNLLTHSRNLGDSSYTYVNNTKTPNTGETTAPDGTNTACKLERTGAAGNAEKSGITANASRLTYSVYVKGGTAASGVYRLYDDTTMGVVAAGTFTYATGALTVTAGTGSVQTLPNSWFRIILTGAATIGNSYRIQYGGVSATPASGSWYIWRPQLEDRDKASEQINTGSSAVYGNGVASFIGGISLTIDGPQCPGVDAYIDTKFNPYRTGINYQGNNAGFGILGKIPAINGTNRLAISQRSSQASLLQTLNAVSQRINAEATMLPLPSLAPATTNVGFSYLARTSGGIGYVINKDVQSSGTFSLSGSLIDSNIILQSYFNNPPNHVYYVGTPSFFIAGGALTYAETQLLRTAYNKFLTRQGLNPIA